MRLAPITYIHRSREQANSALKRLADAGRGFGAAADTPQAFLAAQWELWGDGRPLITAVQRTGMLRALLADQSAIPSSEGAVRVLSRFIRAAQGTPELERALADGQALELDDGERAVLEVLRGYRDALACAGLVEPGDAAAALCATAPCQDIAVAPGIWLPPAQAAFFQKMGWGGYEPRHDWADALAEGVCVSFVRPAGPAAVLSAVAELAGSLAGEGCADALVLAPDAARLFAALAPHAEAAGWSCELDARVPFARTSFGRAMRAVRGLRADDGLMVAHAVDFAYSPWSGMRRSDAARLDARLRADRLTDEHRIEEELAGASVTFPLFRALVRGGEGASDALVHLEHSMAAGEAVLRAADAPCEAAALTSCRAALEQLVSAGCCCGDGDILAVLEDASVAVRKTVPGRGMRLVIRDLSACGEAAERSFDAVVVADASEQGLCARAADDPLARLATRIGLPEPLPPAQALRDELMTGLAAARCRVALVVPLRDAQAAMVQPSYLVEELLSHLTGRAVDAGSADAAMRAVDAAMTVIGEDDFACSVGRRLDAPCGEDMFPAAERGRLRSLEMRRCIRFAYDDGAAFPVLSPSAIEQYARCPYRWFLESRIAPRSLDEGFGPIEKGIFVHEVMARFYGRGMAEGAPRAESAEGAHEALDAAFAEVCAAQLAPDMAGRRLVAATAAERREVEQLRVQLHRFIDLLAALPAAYAPVALEMPIEPEAAVRYGGAILHGRIDRLDADAAGNAAVLDYKGSIKGHAVQMADVEEPGALPEKIQALIYAQAVRRMDGRDAPAAALYLSYAARSAAGLAAGAADASRYPVRELLSAASGACVMPHLLDAVEEAIASRIAALVEGVIAPCAAQKGSCAHCPFEACEGRS